MILFYGEDKERPMTLGILFAVLAPLVTKVINLGISSQGFVDIGIEFVRKFEDSKQPSKLTENALLAVLDLVRTSHGGMNFIYQAKDLGFLSLVRLHKEKCRDPKCDCRILALKIENNSEDMFAERITFDTQGERETALVALKYRLIYDFLEK